MVSWKRNQTVAHIYFNTPFKSIHEYLHNNFSFSCVMAKEIPFYARHPSWFPLALCPDSSPYKVSSRLPCFSDHHPRNLQPWPSMDSTCYVMTNCTLASVNCLCKHLDCFDYLILSEKINSWSSRSYCGFHFKSPFSPHPCFLWQSKVWLRSCPASNIQ